MRDYNFYLDSILKFREDFYQNKNPLNFNQKLDQLFEINFEKIESCIVPSEDNYVGQVLMDGLSTSYADILEIEKHLKKNATIVDVGAGYCRLALILGFIRPDLKIICIEKQPERLFFIKKFINKFKLNIELEEKAIEECKISKFDFLFCYFPYNHSILKFFQNHQKFSYKIFAIESHGDFILFLKNYFLGEECFKIAKTSIQRIDSSIYQFDVSSKFKEKFNKILKNIYQLSQLSREDILFLILNLQYSEYSAEIEFNGLLNYQINEINICFFDQYQIETRVPRRVYKTEQITKILLK